MPHALRQFIRAVMQEGSRTNPELEAKRKAAAAIVGNSFILGDAEYSKLVSRFPGIEMPIMIKYDAFKEAKQRRLQYLESEFATRYDELLKKLGTTPPALDVKAAMIKAVRDAKLFMTRVPEPLDVQKLDKLRDGGYMFDPYTQGAWASGAPAWRAAAHGGNVYTYPPFIQLDSNLKFVKGSDYSDVENNFENQVMIFYHELVHVEDKAIDAGDATASKLDAKLAASVLEDPSVLTIDEVMDRVGGTRLTRGIDTRFKIDPIDKILGAGIRLLALAENIADSAGDATLAGRFRKNYEGEVPQTPEWVDSMRLITADAFNIASTTHIRINLLASRQVISDLATRVASGELQSVRSVLLDVQDNPGIPPSDLDALMSFIAVTNLDKLQSLSYVASTDTPAGSRAV